MSGKVDKTGKNDIIKENLGYYYDTETKLYYLQLRYYDPEIGRFINVDAAEFALIIQTSQATNFLIKKSHKIDVNSDELWYRMTAFNVIWNYFI